MKINFAILCILILVSIIFKFYNSHTIVNFNDYRCFLRICELYDMDSKKRWLEMINNRKQIINYVHKDNKQDQYKFYINEYKKSKFIRQKRKYANRLNIYIERKDINKIKRYLNLILNIFEEENTYLKKALNIYF